ncbi:MAG: hypothetical protein R3293_18395 [Candidatus Promineifilaceae bacterium]|nr:hypothetical protein [Candidatus Promineifilaceae bacterium]
MRFRNLLIVNAVLFLIFGLGFVFIPSTFLSLFGVNPASGTILAAQLYGGLLIGIGLLCWFSKEGSRAAMQGMQISFMIAFAINMVIHAVGTVTGELNILGWSAVLIYLFLTAGYAYFFFTL